MTKPSPYASPGLPVADFVEQFLGGNWPAFIGGVPVIPPNAFRLWELTSTIKPRSFEPVLSREPPS